MTELKELIRELAPTTLDARFHHEETAKGDENQVLATVTRLGSSEATLKKDQAGKLLSLNFTGGHRYNHQEGNCYYEWKELAVFCVSVETAPRQQKSTTSRGLWAWLTSLAIEQERDVSKRMYAWTIDTHHRQD